MVGNIRSMDPTLKLARFPPVMGVLLHIVVRPIPGRRVLT